MCSSSEDRVSQQFLFITVHRSLLFCAEENIGMSRHRHGRRAQQWSRDTETEFIFRTPYTSVENATFWKEDFVLPPKNMDQTGAMICPDAYSGRTAEHASLSLNDVIRATSSFEVPPKQRGDDFLFYALHYW